MVKASTETKRVKAARQARGITPTSLLMTDEEKAELDAFKSEIGAESRAAAILEAIRAYRTQGRISKARLLKELAARLS